MTDEVRYERIEDLVDAIERDVRRTREIVPDGALGA